MEQIAHALLGRIRDENLAVYRASAQRLREDVGQESQIAQDYRGRLIYELLQNADDAMSSNQAEASAIAFVLDDNDLWVANSGRPLDGADVRGLCGISASSKKASGSGRASIGHKGMGFKSVLEITDSPEVYSTTTAFRFGPSEALRAVEILIQEGIIDKVNRAPITRFPWPAESEPQQWKELRARGMNTAFRFPLPVKMTAQQRDKLAAALQSLPVTSLVFLKHLGRVEVTIKTSRVSQSLAWSVKRHRINDSGTQQVPEFSEPGTYRVDLLPDVGDIETFLVAYESQIEIGVHRGGLDEVSWDGVTLTEVSVAARMRNGEPVPLNPTWRKFHVFLPTGEPCPYDLLITAAFNSNLSRQEIRVESDKLNYNGFLLRQVARTLRDILVPRLLSEGLSPAAILRLLDRRIPIRTPCPTIAAQVLYEEVCATLKAFPLIPSEATGLLSIDSCILPPLISDAALGPALRRLLPSGASFGSRFFPAEEYCSSNIAGVLADHGASCLAPEDAAVILAQSDPSRSKLDISPSGKVFVDPILNVLESLWAGLSATDKERLAGAVRREALFPVGMAEGDTARRISTINLACFYPPRALHGEVPLAGLCFLLQEICWGSLTPKERNQELKLQLVAWQALFDVQEFKFPVVMRASVLPALDLDRDGETRHQREELRTMERIAAICQLAGRTSNPNAPLPYERLGTTNRALFNLSRLDLPCRGADPGRIEWIPAYKAYFGQDWIGEKSVECLLMTADENGIKELPEFHFLVPPSEFSGLLEKYRNLREASDSEASDIGADEVSIDEDEEAAIEIDDQSRWRGFLQWLGVNQSLRPVHFHDVEDRASGWLRTSNLSRPEGWIFKNIPDLVWEKYVAGLRQALVEQADLESGTAYFYKLHDLENLVVILNAASSDRSARLGKALYEHLARNWNILESFSKAQVAVVPNGQVPSMRTKPARAKADELIEISPDLWLMRLRESPFCPTGQGPRYARQIWLPTLEVERRFGRRGQPGSALVPTLDVDPAVLKGKARGFAQALGTRDELTPANFSLDDARLLLDRLRDLYSSRLDAGEDLRQDLREVIRPAYRNLFELLPTRERQGDRLSHQEAPLRHAPLLAADGLGKYRFLKAQEIYYADQRDTRERIKSNQPIWTFVIDALQGARSSLLYYFGVRVLEDSLTWYPRPGDPALEQDELEVFRSHLDKVAPYILARIAADRSDDRSGRVDARHLRSLFGRLEPVTSLELGCEIDSRQLDLGHFSRDAFVRLGAGGDPTQAFIVWGERAWPPDSSEAETLASALCDVFGSGYFESFLALVQAKSPGMWERLLRRAGAPLDIEERRLLFLANESEADQPGPGDAVSEDLKTVLESIPSELPAQFPDEDNRPLSDDGPARTPLYSIDQLLIDGEPILVIGADGSPPGREMRVGVPARQSNGRSSGGYGGRTDLELLNEVGMSVALAYERNRLRKSGLEDATVFDPSSSTMQPEALVFDVSTPEKIAKARLSSTLFNVAMNKLWVEFHVSPEWPGFDVLTLDPRFTDCGDRLIELKSSGVASRIQDMTWNEWKTATSSALRDRFYLYLVGNLRSDIDGNGPYIRTIRNPFEQLIADVHVNRNFSRKVQLAVHYFREAEHLELSIRDGSESITHSG